MFLYDKTLAKRVFSIFQIRGNVTVFPLALSLPAVLSTMHAAHLMNPQIQLLFRLPWGFHVHCMGYSSTFRSHYV